MPSQNAHLTLKLDTNEPIELADFVGSFTSLGNEFERFLKTRFPDHKAEVQFFVREVRSGCIEADLYAGLTVVAGVAGVMDQILILEQFVRVWKTRLRSFIDNKQEEQPATKSEIKDFFDATTAIARDPQASHKLEAATFEDGERKVRAVFKFTNAEARTAQQNIEDRSRQIERISNSDRERVLMTFERSRKSSTNFKKTGELVVIEEIDEKPKALLYGSSMVEQEIKREIRDANDNIYKKGFLVDANVRQRMGRTVGYTVTRIHQIVDLPED